MANKVTATILTPRIVANVGGAGAVSAQITSNSAFPTYTGDTDVTPTEMLQTLPTAHKNVSADITVQGIPTDYVGSAVPQRDENDLAVLGAIVTVPHGHYAEDETATVQSGSVSVPNASISTAPTVVVNTTNGVVNAELHETQTVAPIVNEGYVDSGTSGTFSVDAVATYQLPIKAGATVTPTESEQVAVDANRYTVDEVRVGAIPSNYIGSGVPQNDSTDLTASGATVTAASGYYANPASATVQSGSATTPTGGITANPTISVDSNGLITASVTKSESITPIVTEGYVTSGTAGTVSVSGSATQQLSTQAGTTITPTEAVQTAVGANKYTTGAVKVGAISPTYVGSGVTRRSSSDLTASGATVTAPSGYYEEAASQAVANATWKSASTVGVVPEISVDTNGLITVNCGGWTSITPLTASGYADAATSAPIQLAGARTSQLDTQGATTFHPSTSDQTISSQKMLTGTQTFNKVVLSNLTAENIKNGVVVKVGDVSDDDCVASVTGTYSGGGGSPTLVFGAIRPDAELIKTYTYDKYIHADEGVTIPSYATSAQNLKASASLSPTITGLDFANYSYYLIHKCITIPTYSTTTVAKSRNEYAVTVALSECVEIPANTMIALVNPSKMVSSVSRSWNTTNSHRLLYWSSTSALAIYTSQYGVYQSPASPSISGTTMTVKSPALSMRGSTTYLTSSVWGTITDIRYQYVIEVYRAPKGNLNSDGWLYYQLMNHAIADVNTTTHNITTF